MDILSALINSEFLASSIRIATPLIFCALGGLFCMKAGIFNIALEGFMLVGTFFRFFLFICLVEMFILAFWEGFSRGLY